MRGFPVVTIGLLVVGTGCGDAGTRAPDPSPGGVHLADHAEQLADHADAARPEIPLTALKASVLFGNTKVHDAFSSDPLPAASLASGEVIALAFFIDGSGGIGLLHVGGHASDTHGALSITFTPKDTHFSKSMGGGSSIGDRDSRDGGSPGGIDRTFEVAIPAMPNGVNGRLWTGDMHVRLYGDGTAQASIIQLVRLSSSASTPRMARTPAPRIRANSSLPPRATARRTWRRAATPANSLLRAAPRCDGARVTSAQT